MCFRLCTLILLVFEYFFSALALSNVPIIVVGAGPSGIAAATRLLEHNFSNVVILEAENRTGGRIHSVKFGDAIADLGAEFCHGEEGNIVYSMAKPFNILQHSDDWKGGFQFYRSNGERADEQLQRRILSFARSLLASEALMDGCEHALSVGECLKIRSSMLFRDSFLDKTDRTIFSDSIDWIRSYICSFDSTLDLNDLNITSKYKVCPGDLRLNWNGHGYKTILEIMMKKFPDPLKQLQIDDNIKLEQVVTKISYWENDKVTVSTSDGNIYEADHVIFTASVGVLKKNHANLFEPQLLQEKVQAVEKIGFGAIVKVLMHFPERWWGRPQLFSFIFTSEDKEALKQENLEWLISLRGFSQTVNNPNVLTAWYAGKYVPEIETLTDEDLLRGHKCILQKFLSSHYNITIPDSMLRSNWYTNPHFRGTYSFELTNTTKTSNFQEKLATPLVNKNGKVAVLFAGEGTHPYYFSTVHGAIETGYREAERIIKFYTNPVN